MSIRFEDPNLIISDTGSVPAQRTSSKVIRRQPRVAMSQLGQCECSQEITFGDSRVVNISGHALDGRIKPTIGTLFHGLGSLMAQDRVLDEPELIGYICCTTGVGQFIIS